MNKEINQVKEFQVTFNQPVLDFKEKITADRAKLRLNLILEELHELAVSLGEEKHFRWQISKILEKEEIVTPMMSKVTQADALADLEYVIKGTVIECGLIEVFDEVFDEVHASNMSKSIINVNDLIHEELILTTNNIEYEVKTTAKRFVLIRKEDGKIIKPSTYKKPDIPSILNRFTVKQALQKYMNI